MVGVWLSVSQSGEALVQAPRQDYSCIFRRNAIKELGRNLKTRSWENTWNEIGGVEGMLALFAQFSVLEVKQAATMIGNCSKGHRRPARELCVEELLRGLVPFYHKTAHHRSVDERLLLHHYARMVPACSSEFIAEILDQADNPLLAHLNSVQISRYHPTLVQNRIFGYIESKDFNSENRFWPCLPRLCRDFPSDRRNSEGFSPTMVFMLKLLKKLAINQDTELPTEKIIALIQGQLICRAINNHVAREDVLRIANATLKYVERVPEAVRHCHSHASLFLYSLASYWSRHGAKTDLTLDNVLIQCLRLYGTKEPHGFYKPTRSVIENLLPVVSRGLRYALLSHIFKFYTRPSVDLDDVEQVTTLEFSNWSCRWFLSMDRHNAVQLLERLLRTRKDMELLPLGRKDSVFGHPYRPGGQHIDPEPLRTYLANGQTDRMIRAKQSTLHLLASLKVSPANHRTDIRAMQKKSATSIEQSDRAFFAKSAICYAIANSSLNFYGEVLQWSRRFIRDSVSILNIDSQVVANQDFSLP